MTQRTQADIIGKGMRWPPQEDPDTGDIARVSGVESVSNCINCLINRTYDEVPMIETMGTEVPTLLFSADMTSLAPYVGESIRRAIVAFESRAFFISGDFTENRAAGPNGTGRAISIIVRYRLKGTGGLQEAVFPFNRQV